MCRLGDALLFCWQKGSLLHRNASAATPWTDKRCLLSRPAQPTLPSPATSARQPGNSEGCRQEAARALSNLSCNNDVNQASGAAGCSCG